MYHSYIIAFLHTKVLFSNYEVSVLFVQTHNKVLIVIGIM